MRIRDKFAKLCKNGADIPAFSPTAQKLLDISHEEHVSIGEIANVIRLDPGLTSKYLRLANSVAFGGDNGANHRKPGGSLSADQRA